MVKYTFNRIIAICITLLVILTIAFLIIRLMPGSIYRNENLPGELAVLLEEKYHLDQPLYTQYFYFLKNIVVSGDWGTSISIQPKVPVWQVMASRIPVTISLNIISLLISLPLGVLAGIVSAINHNNKVDYVISFAVVVCVSVPAFIFAALLQYTVAFKMGLLPIIYLNTAEGWEKVLSMILPIIALSFSPIARVTRYLRGELLEAVNSDYMLLARTKGLTPFKAAVRHAFRNSLLPLANIIVPMFTNILTGSLVVENIFAVPGIGGLLVSSINSNDHTLTIAILIFYSIVSLITMLVTDLSFGLIDPRVRIGGGKIG